MSNLRLGCQCMTVDCCAGPVVLGGASLCIDHLLSVKGKIGAYCGQLKAFMVDHFLFKHKPNSECS